MYIVTQMMSLGIPPPIFIYFAKCASDCKASSLSSTLPALNTTTGVIWAFCVAIKLQINKCSWSWNSRTRESNRTLRLRLNCLFPWIKWRVNRFKQPSPLNVAPCPHVITFPMTPLFARHDFSAEWIPAQKGLVPGQTPGEESWEHQHMHHLDTVS